MGTDEHLAMLQLEQAAGIAKDLSAEGIVAIPDRQIIAVIAYLHSQGSTLPFPAPNPTAAAPAAPADGAAAPAAKAH